jgi:hypothetical protein
MSRRCRPRADALERGWALTSERSEEGPQAAPALMPFDGLGLGLPIELIETFYAGVFNRVLTARST